MVPEELRTVGAGSWMAQEGADFVGRFRGQDVLELAGLLLDFGFAVHGERVGEQTLGQAMAANNVGGALTSARREFDDQRCRRPTRRRPASAHRGRDSRTACDRAAPADGAGVDTRPMAVIFSTAMRTGSAPWTSMRPTSAISPCSASTQSSSRTSSNCSSSAMAKTSWAAILP